VGVNDAGLATSMIADVIIVSAMVYALLSKRSDVLRTQNIVNRLIIFAIGTSLLTTCALPFDAAPTNILTNRQGGQYSAGDTGQHARQEPYIPLVLIYHSQRSSTALVGDSANMVYFLLPKCAFRGQKAGALLDSAFPVYTNAFLVNLNARHQTSNILNQAQHMTPPSERLVALRFKHTANTPQGGVHTEVRIQLEPKVFYDG
jgi:hypothetical protein